jgi:hypothetical protein
MADRPVVQHPRIQAVPAGENLALDGRAHLSHNSSS